jgi:hypothetical protein
MRKVPGRQYPTHTPLGKLMRHYGLRVKDVEFRTGISYRTLSNYLAGRAAILPGHLRLLSELFQVDPRVLQESDGPPVGTPGGPQASARTVAG